MSLNGWGLVFNVQWMKAKCRRRRPIGHPSTSTTATNTSIVQEMVLANGVTSLHLPNFTRMVSENLFHGTTNMSLLVAIMWKNSQKFYFVMSLYISVSNKASLWKKWQIYFRNVHLVHHIIESSHPANTIRFATHWFFRIHRLRTDIAIVILWCGN